MDMLEQGQWLLRHKMCSLREFEPFHCDLIHEKALPKGNPMNECVNAELWLTIAQIKHVWLLWN